MGNSGSSERKERPFGAQLYGDRDVFRNARLTVWPDGSKTLTVCDRAVFRVPGFEQQKGAKRHELPPTAEDRNTEAEQDGKWLSDYKLPPKEQENVARAVRRAKARLRAIARANAFEYFITLTLSPEIVNRYDDAGNMRRLSNWLRNASARFGLCYVLVPERHKDGALHFHGLINGALRVEDSGTIIPPEGGRPRRPADEEERQELLNSGGKIVYNLPQWGYGFTTALRLYGEYAGAVNYVCKYIGKDMDPLKGCPQKIGGRWVYAGGPLREPEEHLLNIDYDEAVEKFAGTDFEVKATGDKYHVAEVGDLTEGG